MNPVQTLGEIHGTESKTIIAPTPSDRWRRARAAQNKVTRPHPEEAFDESPKVSQSAVTSSAPWGLAHPTGGRNVTHLAALGLGSLGALRRPASDVVGRSSRAPYRLFQLALALAIADKLRMSGSENLHLTFSDPAFEDLDLDLINSFEGIKVLPLDGDSSIFMPDLGGQKLLYMPCCPRDLVRPSLEHKYFPLGHAAKSISGVLRLFLKFVSLSTAVWGGDHNVPVPREARGHCYLWDFPALSCGVSMLLYMSPHSSVYFRVLLYRLGDGAYKMIILSKALPETVVTYLFEFGIASYRETTPFIQRPLSVL